MVAKRKVMMVVKKVCVSLVLLTVEVVVDDYPLPSVVREIGHFWFVFGFASYLWIG